MLERIIAMVALIIVSPIIGLSLLGVALSSRGPLIFKAPRIGKDGIPFQLYKIRTMHVPHAGELNQRVTSKKDNRIFFLGRVLRLMKIDELPQLVNVLKGDMAIVGPRPEDPYIVENEYKDWRLETLAIRPGLTSPGALFNYTHFSKYVSELNAEESYIRNFLDRKLALDAVYANKKSCLYDMSIIARTVGYITALTLGFEIKKLPPEASLAEKSYGVSY